MKKKKSICFIIMLIIIISILLFYKTKPITKNNISSKPNFIATVLDVWDEGILVLVDSKEDEYKSSDKISVSLDNVIKASVLNLKTGDKIKIFYDGTILESYPAQIHTPYKILKITN